MANTNETIFLKNLWEFVSKSKKSKVDALAKFMEMVDDLMEDNEISQESVDKFMDSFDLTDIRNNSSYRSSDSCGYTSRNTYTSSAC
jgi:hypothetical protein